MFELTISINSSEQKYISDLYKKLYDEVKKDSGILIKQNYHGRSYVALAINEKKKEYYKSKILDYIAYIVVDLYKFNYYKENLQCPSKCILAGPFYKAITIFDDFNDRDVISKIIDLSGEVLVDSFYNFKLQSLRENRWDRTIDIIRKNQVMESETSMMNIVRYLTLMTEYPVLLCEVHISKNQIKIKNSTITKTFKRDKSGEENFLTEIVAVNPEKINLKIIGDIDESDEVFYYLKSIFTDKIYLI